MKTRAHRSYFDILYCAITTQLKIKGPGEWESLELSRPRGMEHLLVKAATASLGFLLTRA